MQHRQPPHRCAHQRRRLWCVGVSRARDALIAARRGVSSGELLRPVLRLAVHLCTHPRQEQGLFGVAIHYAMLIVWSGWSFLHQLPVARAADEFGQRKRRGRYHGARGLKDEQLERESGAMDSFAPAALVR